jgi:putative transcriptional regulator
MMFDVIKIRLKERLKAENKTLYRVAKDTGLSYPALNAIKQGKVTDIRLSTLEKLCGALNCTPNDLITFSK